MNAKSFLTDLNSWAGWQQQAREFGGIADGPIVRRRRGGGGVFGPGAGDSVPANFVGALLAKELAVSCVREHGFRPRHLLFAESGPRRAKPVEAEAVVVWLISLLRKVSGSSSYLLCIWRVCICSIWLSGRDDEGTKCVVHTANWTQRVSGKSWWSLKEWVRDWCFIVLICLDNPFVGLTVRYLLRNEQQCKFIILCFEISHWKVNYAAFICISIVKFGNYE